MFITPAFAQAAGASTGGADLLIQFVPFIFVFAIMWFLMIRPQRQKQKAHQEMIKGARRGDTVVLSGGLIGKINKVVDDSELLLEVAEGVRVRVSRASIADVRAKGEPAKDGE